MDFKIFSLYQLEELHSSKIEKSDDKYLTRLMIANDYILAVNSEVKKLQDLIKYQSNQLDIVSILIQNIEKASNEGRER